MHRTRAEFEAAVDDLRAAPSDEGVLEMVVRRPAVDEREILDVAQLSALEGVVGDTWNQRSSKRTDDGSPHPEMQLNVINARMARLMAGTPERMALAGDQLYVDFDLSDSSCPPGTRLGIGSAVIEITAQPHTGCAKFAQRFGTEAARFVNSPVGKELHLRGVNARVVVEGTIRPGDRIVRV